MSLATFSGTLPLDASNPDSSNIRIYVRWIRAFAQEMNLETLNTLCEYFATIPADQRDAHYRLSSQAILREAHRRQEAARQTECDGHESLRGDSMGLAVYCPNNECVAVRYAR